MAALQPHPVSLKQVLDALEPHRSAKFLHTEYPIRCSERILLIESIPAWRENVELADVHARHMRAFGDMLRVKRHPGLDDFTQVAHDIVHKNVEVIPLMAKGLRRLVDERPAEFDSAFVDKFLDTFLLNRIGSNVLLSQYLACVAEDRPQTGIVDPRCNVVEVCENVAVGIRKVCRKQAGLDPLIRVRAYCAAGSENGPPRLPYIPAMLGYIMQEILKNSCRATLDKCKDAASVEERPITVTVCADETRVLIQISDQAGGIPFDVGQHVWSYTYTTADHSTELAGYGVGLPLSRLYARYLGGSLDLVSLPGYGTNAYLFLPRLSSEQIEVVPDMDAYDDHHYRRDSKCLL